MDIPVDNYGPEVEEIAIEIHQVLVDDRIARHDTRHLGSWEELDEMNKHWNRVTANWVFNHFTRNQ